MAAQACYKANVFDSLPYTYIYMYIYIYVFYADLHRLVVIWCVILTSKGNEMSAYVVAANSIKMAHSTLSLQYSRSPGGSISAVLNAAWFRGYSKSCTQK